MKEQKHSQVHRFECGSKVRINAPISSFCGMWEVILVDSVSYFLMRQGDYDCTARLYYPVDQNDGWSMILNPDELDDQQIRSSEVEVSWMCVFRNSPKRYV